ncbi:MAG TPA: hypothetical protein VF103_05040 [Polyangiaceae bacterium]
MSERRLGRIAVALTLAVAIGTLFWIWAEFDWKNLGGRAGVVAVTAAGAALAALFGERMARRPTPIDWIHELVRTAMLVTLVSGIGMLVSYLGDAEPSGGAPAIVTNNEPDVSTPLFKTLMLAATVLAMTSVLPIWRHRHAVRTSRKRPLAETLVACGAWLAAVVAALCAVALSIGLELARVLVPHAMLALVMIAVGVVLFLRRMPRVREGVSYVFAVSGGVLATATAVVGLTGFPFPGRELYRNASACLAGARSGLLLDALATPVTAYRAAGISLRRIECRSTFQYNDERRTVVVGRDENDRDVFGAKLFVRVGGSPLERARAACEILLSERCEAPLAFPSELLGFSTVPEGDLLAPHERGGRLAFLAITYEYPHGRRTTVGRRRIVVPHEVDLATGALVDAR